MKKRGNFCKFYYFILIRNYLLAEFWVLWQKPEFFSLIRDPYCRTDEGKDQYNDYISYNKRLCQHKEQRVLVAQEVVRILEEFGAKLGEELPGYECIESPESQHSVGLKIRRYDSQ